MTTPTGLVTPWKAGVAGALVAFACMYGGLTLSWGRGHASINGGYYMLSEMRAFEVAGFAQLWGIPHLGVLPTDPPIGHPYVHHPPGWPALLFAFTRLSGLTPLGLRLLPTLLTTLSVGLLVAWMIRRGVWWPLPVLLVGTMPIVGIYGSMPNPEAAVQLVLVLGLFANELRRERIGWPKFVVFALAIVGPWLDWQGAFLAPAILLRELLAARPQQKWKFPILVAALTTTSCLGLVMWLGTASLHLDAIRIRILESPSSPLAGAPAINLWSAFEAGINQVKLIGHGSATASVALEPQAWISGINETCLQMFLCPLYLGLVLMLVGHRHFRHLAPIALPGVLNLGIFRLHASQHAFWVIHLLPAVAWLATTTLDDFLLRKRGEVSTTRRAVCVGIAFTFATLATVTFLERRDSDRDGSVERLAVALRQIQRPGIAFASSTPLGTATSHLEGYVIDVPPQRVPELVMLASRGVLRHELDVILPHDPEISSLRALAPSHVSIAPIELVPGTPSQEALTKWAGDRPLIRLTIHSTHK